MNALKTNLTVAEAGKMATVCIVGANRGIGLALARVYERRGDMVIAGCRSASPELLALDVRVVEGLEVAGDAAVSSWAQEVTGEQLDLLIHNAGISRRVTWDALDFDAMREQFEVNTLGPMRVIKALEGSLGSGSRVAVITSRMGSVEDNTSGSHYGYRISKCGVNMMVRSLAQDIAEDGIAVGVFHPGYVRTDMTHGQGFISAEECADMLVQRFDELKLENAGRFFHANGEELPW